MDEQKNGDVKNSNAAGEGSVTVVLEMELFCDGCTAKVKRAVEKFKGIEDLKIDGAANRVTVTGKVNPTEIREELESKAKRKVEIVAVAPPPPPKNGGGNGAAEEKDKEKETMVVLSTRLQCVGCINKINKIIWNFKGVEFVSMDSLKESITIKGTMDTEKLVPYLQNKLKRAEVATVPSQSSKPEPPASIDNKESTKSKEPATESAIGDTKESDEVANKEVGPKKDAEGSSSSSSSSGGEPEMEVRNKEFQGRELSKPSGQNGGNTCGPSNSIPADQVFPYSYLDQYPYAIEGHYVNHDDYYMMNYHVYAPQLFSDETCPIM